MHREEILDLLYDYYCSQFPKVCSPCGRRYETLTEYIKTTRAIGNVISHDADAGNWGLKRPVGSVAMVNCSCGSTLSLSTDDMPMNQRERVLEWVHEETERSGVAHSEVLEALRAAVRERALSE